MFDELDCQITYDEIKKAINQLKNGRSGGPDKFLNEFFIHGNNDLLMYLHSLFNKILDLECLPESWSEGEHCAIAQQITSMMRGNILSWYHAIKYTWKRFHSYCRGQIAITDWAEKYSVIY